MIVHRALLRIVVANGPECGRYVMADATDEGTWAIPDHDCRPGECSLGKEGQQLGRFARAPRLRVASAEEAALHRDANVKHGIDPAGRRPDTEGFVELVTGDIDETEVVTRELGSGTRRYLRIRTGGHWYLIADADAGVRLYARDGRVIKAWIGRFNHSAVCMHNGLKVAHLSYAASLTEHDHVQPLVEQAEENCGRKVEAVATDRGCTVAWVAEQQSRQGRLLVTPPRKHPTLETRWVDKPHADRHHVWRCRHCRHETQRVSFLIDEKTGKTVIRVRCIAQLLPACDGIQEHDISKDPLRALPLPATDPTYLVLAYLQQQYERSHRLQRQRNAAAGNTRQTVPQRTGWAVSNAYGIVGMTLDTLRYCLRSGYLKAPANLMRQPKVVPGRLQRLDDLAAELVDKLERHRREALLHLPYGEGAERFGGFTEPPSHRQPEPDEAAAA